MNNAFVINVTDIETNKFPSYITVNDLEHSLTIDMNKITSVGNKTIIQYLKLILSIKI